MKDFSAISVLMLALGLPICATSHAGKSATLGPAHNGVQAVALESEDLFVSSDISN